MKRKLLLILIKYLPLIQLVGILLSNTLYYFDVCRVCSYILDWSVAQSVSAILLFYICSYTFEFCVWHRLIITANLINISIAIIDIIFVIPIGNLELLTIYYLISAIFILIATYTHIKHNGRVYNKHKTKNVKKYSSRSYRAY